MYDGSYTPVFENVSFNFDTSWHLGLIGRNGKGKTTLLRLLQKQYTFQGHIDMPLTPVYFPYPVADDSQTTREVMLQAAPDAEEWMLICELNQLDVDDSVLERPFSTLSKGEQTKALLAARGYAGALLVPQDKHLTQMYQRMGFQPCTTVSEFWCAPEIPAAAIYKIDASAYIKARSVLLPKGSVLQEGENIAFLDKQATFYEGPGCLAAVTMDGENLHCFELLGDSAAAPQILTALGLSLGFFRCPGKGKPFAMLCPLASDCPIPTYFGLAFD